MKFKVDENLPQEVVEFLMESGHDAKSVEEQGLSGAPDLKLADVCVEEGRALVTLDVGFGDIVRYPPIDYPGIILFRLSSQGKASIVQATERFVSELGAGCSHGQLWIVEDNWIRLYDGDN